MRAKINDLDKIKVAAVNYLNTKPLLYGIKRHAVLKQIDLIEVYPSKVAQMVLDGSADLGLIPVAVIPQLKESHIITDYCIGCDGAVASVCIFCNVPIEEITELYLDYQSRTSVQLAQILLKEYWKREVQIIKATSEDFRSKISGTTAAVIIGDRALEQRLQSAYIYDLGEAWKAFTGLPFVFAAWVSNKKLPNDFIAAFNEANGLGFNHLDEVIAENPFSGFDLKEYYTKYISYNFNTQKKEGIKTFLQFISL